MMQGNTSTGNQPQSKSLVVAYLLWFFFGGIGAHRFYFGRVRSGLGMAGLFVGSVALSAVVIGLIGFPILMGWWIADAFMMSKWPDQPEQPVAGSVPQQTTQTPSQVQAESERQQPSQAA